MAVVSDITFLAPRAKTAALNVSIGVKLQKITGVKLQVPA
jgi:hypothetical protein